MKHKKKGLESYLRKKNCAETKRKYRSVLSLFQSYTGIRLENCTQQNVIEWLEHLKEDGRAMSTMRVYVTVARDYLRYNGRKTDKIVIPREQKRENGENPLNPVDIERLYSATKSYRDLLLLHLLLETGLSVGEITALNGDDIDPATNMIRVYGRHERTIYYPSNLDTIMVDYHTYESNGDKKRLIPLTTSRVRMIVKETAKSAGLDYADRLCPELCRHYYARRLWDETHNILTVKTALGQKSIQATIDYLGLTEEEMRREYEDNN